MFIRKKTVNFFLSTILTQQNNNFKSHICPFIASKTHKKTVHGSILSLKINNYCIELVLICYNSSHINLSLLHKDEIKIYTSQQILIKMHFGTIILTLSNTEYHITLQIRFLKKACNPSLSWNATKYYCLQVFSTKLK